MSSQTAYHLFKTARLSCLQYKEVHWSNSVDALNCRDIHNTTSGFEPELLKLFRSSYKSQSWRCNFVSKLAPDWLSLISLYHVCQEMVVKTLGKKLDEDTLQTVTLAEQLNTNLTELNLRIEGTRQFCSSTTDSLLLSVSCSSVLL